MPHRILSSSHYRASANVIAKQLRLLNERYQLNQFT